MRVLVIQNFADEGLGLLGQALEEARAEVEIVRPFAGDALPDAQGPDAQGPDAQDYDALVVLGGGQNALDDEGSPWFAKTLELIRAFQDSERSVLGICLGSQLVARANGSVNHIGGHYEFGWHEVALSEAAKDDAVLGSLPAAFPIFQWHDDHFTLPANAVRLASSGTAENQAFRIGRATYGSQFHFEASRKHVERWSTEFAALIVEREPDWQEGRHARDAAASGAAADAAGLLIARGWVATIGGEKSGS